MISFSNIHKQYGKQLIFVDASFQLNPGEKVGLVGPDGAGEMDRVLARFGDVQEEYDHLGGYTLEAQAREVLHGLGFEDDQIDGDVGALSGGWKMRVALARVLLGRPNVLLMDEPTNHLDIESIIWL